MKNKFYFKTALIIAMAVGINVNVQAQTYFAGTGAGTGNTGAYCTGVGYNSLHYANSGNGNSAFGYKSLSFNTSGGHNTATGILSLYSNSTGYTNTAIGSYSLYSNTTGYRNTAIGSSSLYNNTGGFENTAIGGSLYNNTTGYRNTATGYNSLSSNTAGYYNTANGYGSLNYNTTGYSNTASGSWSLNYNTTGYSNTGIGDSAMFSNTTGFVNVAIGKKALVNNTAGNNNVAVGKVAGGKYTAYSNCTFVGSTADASQSGFANATAIGFGARVDANNKVTLGNTSVTSIGGQVGWTTLSDLRLKENISQSKLGLDFILQLNPVTYNYKAEGQRDILYTGLIAQEVDAAAKKEGVDFSGVDKNGEYWGIRYGELTVPLIKSVQEMNEENNNLKEKVSSLETTIQQMQQCLETLCNANEFKISSNFQINESSNLFQNNPNPFKENTTIGFNISRASGKAMLKIFSMNGEEQKSIVIATKGKGQVEIAGNTLAPGVYTYVLLVDDKTVDTKQMVVTK